MDVFGIRAFCLIILLTIVTADGVEFTQEINNKIFRYIRRYWNRGTYNETSDWCASIGGRLPMLHTQEDLNYLAGTVVGRSFTDPHLTWLGSSVSPGGRVCQWADGTPIEAFHTFTTSCQSSDSSSVGGCPTGSNCCALTMWSDNDFKKLTVRKCTERLWQVCVIEESSTKEKIIAMNESIAQLNKEVQSIKSSMTEVETNLRSTVDDLMSGLFNYHISRHQEDKSDLKNKTELQFSDLESRLSDTLNKTSKIISDKQSFIDNEVNNMAEEFVSFKDQIERLNMSSRRLQDRMNRVNSTLEEAKSVLDDKVSLTEKIMREGINQVSQSANDNLRNESIFLRDSLESFRKQQELQMKLKMTPAEQQYKSLKEMNQRTRNLLYVMIICVVLVVAGMMVMQYKGVNLFLLRAKFADHRNIQLNFPSSRSRSSLIPPCKSESEQNLVSCV